MRNGEILISVGYLVIFIGFIINLWKEITGENPIKEFLKDLKNIKEWF